MRKCRITVVSLPDRENLVAEISYDGFQFAEISQETGQLMIQFYRHPNKEFWGFSLEEFQKIVEKAKQKLIEIG
ncbi:MAG: hypothetical protein WC688_05420 [Parachlamydiales bacterium]|jgi:hypothetical protein